MCEEETKLQKQQHVRQSTSFILTEKTTGKDPVSPALFLNQDKQSSGNQISVAGTQCLGLPSRCSL